MASIFQYTPINSDYHSPTPGEITLLAGKPNLSTDGLASDLCKELELCGFNAASAVIKQEYILSSLQNCADNHIKLFLTNGSLINPDLTEWFVNKFKGEKGLGGWFLDVNFTPFYASGNELDLNRDENGELETKCFRTKSQILAEIKTIIESCDTDHSVFIGLSGDWKYDLHHRDLKSYPDYIAHFQADFRPSFWPVSYFPGLVLSNGGTNPEDRVLNFYKTMYYFAYIAQYTAVPFWAFCRCQGFTKYNGLDAPNPSVNSLRGMVFTALAFGAQGIYYWDYRQSADNGSLKYSYAPVTRNNEKTVTWDMVRTVNMEVKAFNSVFCGCSWVETRFVTRRYDLGYLKIMDNPMGPLTEVLSFGVDDEIQISHISNGDRNYLVVVCNAFVNPKPTTIPNPTRVMFTFNNYWGVYLLTMNGTSYREDKLSASTFSRDMDPGSYLIFRWE